MDCNVVVMTGRLSAPAELREFDSGSRLLRLLMTVRVDAPRRRTDVVPVTLWDPPPELLDPLPEKEQPVFLVASVQRRFWDAAEGRRSRMEVVAHHIELLPDDEDAPRAGRRRAG